MTKELGQVWASMNLKGGVGKTTLTANISRAIANKGPYKILMIDTDPQCSLTLIFKSEKEVDKIDERRTFYDILSRPTSDMQEKIKHCKIVLDTPAGTTIHLIPAHVYLIRPMLAGMMAGVNQGYSFDDMRQNFTNLINTARADYDLVVLDTNPSGNIATYLAVTHAGFIIAPISNDRFSIRGISLMREVFSNQVEWLQGEPWRLIPIINNVAGDREAARVRNELVETNKAFAEEALIEYVKHSGLLKYTDKKQGFAVDRGYPIINTLQQLSVADNLDRVSEALIKKTKLPLPTNGAQQ